MRMGRYQYMYINWETLLCDVITWLTVCPFGVFLLSAWTKRKDGEKRSRNASDMSCVMFLSHRVSAGDDRGQKYLAPVSRLVPTDFSFVSTTFPPSLYLALRFYLNPFFFFFELPIFGHTREVKERKRKRQKRVICLLMRGCSVYCFL